MVKKTGQSRSDSLRCEIIRAIEAGEYKPGAALPTVRQLGEQHGISYVVASVALNRLVEEGWVTKRQGSGTFVKEQALRVPGCIHLYTTYPLTSPMKKAINRFQNAYSQIQVVMVDSPREADVITLGTSGARGLHDDGLLYPLADFLKEVSLSQDDFLALPMVAGTFDDTPYALPYSAGIDLLYYNRDLLEDEELDSITRWDFNRLSLSFILW